MRLYLVGKFAADRYNKYNAKKDLQQLTLVSIQSKVCLGRNGVCIFECAGMKPCAECRGPLAAAQALCKETPAGQKEKDNGRSLDTRDA